MAIYRIETDDGTYEIDADSEQAALSALPQQKAKPDALDNASGLLDRLIGSAEVIGTVGSSMAGTAVGGLAGIAQAINPFAEQGAGAKAVENVRNAMTMRPQTESGQSQLDTLGRLMELGVDVANIPISGLAGIAELVSGQGVDKAAETLNSIRERGLGKTLGNRAFEETGSPLIASLAETAPDAVSSIIGTKAGMMAAGAAKQAGKELAAVAPVVAGKAADVVQGAATSAQAAGKQLFQYQTPARKRIADQIKSGSTDIDVARFTMKGDKAVKDAPAVEAIRQGFDEGIVAVIKNASRADKDVMLRMVNSMERGKKNAKEAATIRPSDAAGETILRVFNSVKTANRRAAEKIEPVAKSLKTEKVDYSPAINRFISDLENIGVKFNTDRGIRADYTRADFQGLTGIEAAVDKVIDRLSNTDVPTAYDVHRMKKYLDEIVTYGSGGVTGLQGSVEVILKNLRHNLDEILDTAFPEYNKVNTEYAETRRALDAFQEVAGTKMNLAGENADSAVGTLLTRLLGKQQSRVPLLDAVIALERVADKRGGSGLLMIEGKGLGKNDLISQVLFFDELDRVFGPVARTSFQGQIDQAIKRGAKAATGRGIQDIAIDAVAAAAEKARGINQEAAFKSIKSLLSR
jgi:hypothetical protein